MKCKNPSCKRLTDNPNGYCCIECKIAHECLKNPRKTNREIELELINRIRKERRVMKIDN